MKSQRRLIQWIGIIYNVGALYLRTDLNMTKMRDFILSFLKNYVKPNSDMHMQLTKSNLKIIPSEDLIKTGYGDSKKYQYGFENNDWVHERYLSRMERPYWFHINLWHRLR